MGDQTNHRVLVANYSRCGTSRARPEDPDDHGPYQYDYGRQLRLAGFKDLPQNFEMFFDIGMGKAITRIGTDGVVDIPDVCFERFGELKSWLFLHEGETDGETRYTVKTEIRSRAKAADDEPTPEGQSAITQAIAALNAGVEAAQDAQHAAESAAETAAEDARQAADDALTGKADKTDTVLLTTLSRGRKANTTVGNNSLAFGYNVEASGLNSSAFGNSTASAIDAFASGFGSAATGRFSSAFGDHNIASGQSAFASGDYNEASGSSSSAGGSHTTASGDNSRSDGTGTVASGLAGHSEGRGTIANHRAQHASGEYNIADDSSAAGNARGNYVEIVGNGTADNARSNARTLDWDGNEWISGSMTVGGPLTIGGTTITEEQLQALLAGLTATQVTGNQYSLGLERT